MTERLRVREIDDEEGRRLVQVICHGAGVGSDLAAGADSTSMGSAPCIQSTKVATR